MRQVVVKRLRKQAIEENKDTQPALKALQIAIDYKKKKANYKANHNTKFIKSIVKKGKKFQIKPAKKNRGTFKRNSPV